MVIRNRYLRRLLEYSGTGNWIYTTRILTWAFDRAIVEQLPIYLRLFCLYVRVYSRFIKTPTIIFGHGLYRVLNLLLPPVAGPYGLIIHGKKVWLDLGDPGALWAIQELSVGSALPSLIESLTFHADVFVDVGANQGIFSAIASRTVRPGATIIAIEPQPRLAACIEKTLQASSVKHWKVLITAVSNRSGTLDLVIPSENQGEAHLSTTTPSPGLVIPTQVALLDDLLADINCESIVVVKMDIEGVELDALQGGRAFFQRCRPILIMELNPTAMARYGHSLNDIIQILSNLGYQRWASIDQPEERYPVDSLPYIQCDIVLHMARATE
jgi:FkbM family methyltransferase